MEDSTVPRAIRNTIECTLREHSIVMNRIFDARRAGCAIASFAHREALPSCPASGEFSCKMLTFAGSCDKISFVTEICDMDF